MKNIGSILLCACGAYLGFETNTWWSIALGIVCALGAIAAFAGIFYENKNEKY